MRFSIVILFYHSTVIQSFIDIFTLNSININNVLNAFLYLYIKLLKQVQTHLSTAYTFHKYFKLKLRTERNSHLSCLHLNLNYKLFRITKSLFFYLHQRAYVRVTIFWLPKTRTLGPAMRCHRPIKWYSKFTQRCLINVNTFKVCLLCMDRKLLYYKILSITKDTNSDLWIWQRHFSEVTQHVLLYK